MSIMLPSESDRNNRSRRGWTANDLTPHDVAPLLDNFVTKFTPGKPEECWPWRGYVNPNGYGVQGRAYRAPLLAHRLSWVAFTGQALTDELTIDHLCFTKACVNPAHLEPVTLRENTRRAVDHYGHMHGGKRRRKSEKPRRSPTPIVDEDDYRRRTRASSKAYYEANREKVRAAAEVRGSKPKECEHCGLTIRSDGMRRHIRRMHSGPRP